MITACGDGGGNGGRSCSRSSSPRHTRYAGRILGLLLLVLLQLEPPVHFQTAAAAPEDSSSAGQSSPVSSASTSGSAAQSATAGASSSLLDGIILDEDGVLLGAGQQTLSEEAAAHLLFQPRLLDFAERSIGDPHNRIVVLLNRHQNRSVYLGSISGSTAELSSSYFKEKVIPPGGNTSFNVVFLPRKLGPADGSLLIHTSFGMLRYQVQGEGVECPYRLRPLVGLQAPLNATISPEITLYNPHDTPLQIVEVYSSGGSFQLELPSGAQEGPQTLWEIPPHSTRTVIRVRFHARTPGTHVAYVRIKISGGTADPSIADKMLVVPIEVETSKETGLYSPIPFLELGVTSSLSEEASAARRTSTVAASPVATPVETHEGGLSVHRCRGVTRISLALLNSGSQPVRVKSWGVQADDIESVLCMHVLVVEERTLHVEFDWSKLTSDRRQFSGRILLNLERVQSSADGDKDNGEEEEEEEEEGDEQQHQQHQQQQQQQQEQQTQDESAGTEAGRKVEDGAESAEEGAGRGSKVVMSIYAIPFAGEVLKGSIQYNEDVLRFLLPSDEQEVEDAAEAKDDQKSVRMRPLVIRNHFNVPLSVTNVSVPENCTQYFAIDSFRPAVLQENSERTLFRIALKSLLTSRLLNRSTITTHIRVRTNISDYELPVLGYSGRLEKLLSPTVRDASLLTPTGFVLAGDERQELDFGVLPIATIGEALVAFRNPNPVPIPIIHWKGAITSDASVGAPTITVILRGCGPLRLDGLVFCHTVQPGEWIVYQISVQSGTIDSYQGRFTVKTDYEEIVTPLRFTTAVGELHLMRERLRFSDCFPGKLCSLSLLAASSFPSKIQIESIRSDVPGLGYEFLSPEKQRPLAANQPVTLHPDTVTSIGRLTFDPKAHCGPSDCYSSFDLLSKPFGVKWMATLDCYEQYRRLDSDKLLQQLQRYAEMRQRLTSVHFQVLAESSRRFDFNASVDLVWPKLLDENVFFPTLQTEHEAVRLITINNPSDQILFVHLVLHDVAVHGQLPAVDGSVGLPPEVLTACDNCTLSEESVFSFFLFDSDDIYVNYMKPLSFLRIAVKFSARLPGTYSTVLYMRNNLTLIDAVWIQARAVVPAFKFGNRRPGSPTALQFEITDKHLQPCLARYYRQMCAEGRVKVMDWQGQAMPCEQGYPYGQQAAATPEETPEPKGFAVETRRTFTARNYGEVPIVISGIRIEEAPCEGYGFKVLDCAPFELAPNASRKIEIAFAPDFTLSRVVRVLHFDTNINLFPVNFTLLGTVPMHRLDICSRSLPRPGFEYWFRAFLFVVLPTALFGTLAAAVLDSNRVLRAHFLSLVREKGPLQPPLDLRQIALQHSSTVAPDGGGKDRPDARTTGTASSNGSIAGTSAAAAVASLVSRNHRKPERKNGTQPKATAGAGSLQNGSANGGESSTSRVNRSWTDFTARLTMKPTSFVAASSPSPSSPLSSSSEGTSSSPEGSRASQSTPTTKSRRSITPPKEPPSVESHSASNGSSSGPYGATKERTKPASSPAAETESKLARSAAPCGGKTTPTSDLTGALESNSTATKQHHHAGASASSSSDRATEEPALEEVNLSSGTSSLSSSSSSSCSSSSTVSSSSSSPSPTSKQQHAPLPKQPPAPVAAAASNSASKTNVKKTKSLPVSYESVVGSYATALVTAAAAAFAYTSQKPTAEVTASASLSSSTTVTPSASVAQVSTKEVQCKLRPGSHGTNGGPASGKQFASSNGGGNAKKTVEPSPRQPESSSNNGTGMSGSERTNSVGSGSTVASEGLGKENSSSGNIIVLEKPAASGGNAQTEPSQPQQPQHQQTSSSKKFSKTPGRERKPNQKKGSNGGKGQSVGSQQYKGTALHFNTPSQQQHKSTALGTILQNASVPVPSSNGTLWGENCARFSDVVAQTSGSNAAKSSGGTPTAVTSTLLGMDLLVGLSALSGGNGAGGNNSNTTSSDQSAAHHLRTFGSAFGSTVNTHNRKTLHTVPEVPGCSTGPSNRAEQKSKDDSYLGGTSERESSLAPFVSTSASPDLGPIGTSKKSPTGGSNGDGDGGECDGFGRPASGRTGANVTKCWEPFGGHVIHNPTQLSSGSGEATIGKASNGGQQSDSFFSQSFTDFHHRQNEQYRGISSMAGASNGTMNGTTTSSMLPQGSHGYSDHSTSLLNGGHHTTGAGANDYMDNRSAGHSMRHQQHHHQQQQQRDWNSPMDSSLQWPLSSHKPMVAQSNGMDQNWGSSDPWNNLSSQHQYQQHQQHYHHQQQQQQQQMAYSSTMRFQAQLAAAAAEAGQLSLQHLQQTVPDVGWYTAPMATNQGTLAPPPGFSNHLPSSVASHANLLTSQRSTLHELYRQTFYDQRMTQHRMQQQHCGNNGQLAAEDPTVGTGDGSSGGPSSPNASSSSSAAIIATSSTGSSTASTGSSSSAASSSPSMVASYDPFQLESIWGPGSIAADVWAAEAAAASKKK